MGFPTDDFLVAFSVCLKPRALYGGILLLSFCNVNHFFLQNLRFVQCDTH